jgi:hypothetical protein
MMYRVHPYSSFNRKPQSTIVSLTNKKTLLFQLWTAGLKPPRDYRRLKPSKIEI